MIILQHCYGRVTETNRDETYSIFRFPANKSSICEGKVDQSEIFSGFKSVVFIFVTNQSSCNVIPSKNSRAEPEHSDLCIMEGQVYLDYPSLASTLTSDSSWVRLW